MICFFNDTTTSEIYTLSLHDALPILSAPEVGFAAPILKTAIRQASAPMTRASATVRRVPEELRVRKEVMSGSPVEMHDPRDRKSTRLNSSHANISYAVFCLKKKKTGI